MNFLGGWLLTLNPDIGYSKYQLPSSLFLVSSLFFKSRNDVACSECSTKVGVILKPFADESPVVNFPIRHVALFLSRCDEDPVNYYLNGKWSNIVRDLYIYHYHEIQSEGVLPIVPISSASSNLTTISTKKISTCHSLPDLKIELFNSNTTAAVKEFDKIVEHTTKRCNDFTADVSNSAMTIQFFDYNDKFGLSNILTKIAEKRGADLRLTSKQQEQILTATFHVGQINDETSFSLSNLLMVQNFEF